MTESSEEVLYTMATAIVAFGVIVITAIYCRNRQQMERKRNTELHGEALFRQPPLREECPICFLPLPLDGLKSNYQSCCGKIICNGCLHAVAKGDIRCLCPFCRAPMPASDGEYFEMVTKRAEVDDANAICQLACYYRDEKYGLQQDLEKANELWLRAGELGVTNAYCTLGGSYFLGKGVERDFMKGKHFLELAVMGGDVSARHLLGVLDGDAGNMSRAVRHFMIAAGAGHDDSLRNIRECFVQGHATKEEFEKALRGHKEATDEMTSDQREEAAAADA